MKTTTVLPNVANGLESLALYNVAFTVTDLEEIFYGLVRWYRSLN